MRKAILFILFSTLVLKSFSQATVTDYDGNIYDTIHIGNQIWLKQNLNSTHYSDGTPIPYNCYYNNDDSLRAIYGTMMIWESAMNNAHNETTQGACPIGWHVPSDFEWGVLINYLGGPSAAGYKLKESGTIHWKNPNTGTNSSGFTALPGGDIYSCNWSELIGEYAQFWTSTEINSSEAQNWCMSNQSNEIFRHYNFDQTNGFSVRCTQNYPTQGIIENTESNEISLLPIPANDYVVIPVTAEYSISIFNILGQKMKYVTEIQKSINEKKIDVSNLPEGAYFIKASNSHSEITTDKFGKFLVIHYR